MYFYLLSAHTIKTSGFFIPYSKSSVFLQHLEKIVADHKKRSGNLSAMQAHLDDFGQDG